MNLNSTKPLRIVHQEQTVCRMDNRVVSQWVLIRIFSGILIAEHTGRRLLVMACDGPDKLSLTNCQIGGLFVSRCFDTEGANAFSRA